MPGGPDDVLHAVLEQQLRKVGASNVGAPTLEQWRALLARVSAAYTQEDKDRYALERSIALSTQEMSEIAGRLATERDRLQVTIASMADGVCVLDAEGKVQVANRAAERMLEAEPGGLAGRDFVEVVSGSWPREEERRMPLRRLDAALRGGGACRCDDARFMTLKREWLPVSYALTPIDATAGVSVLTFADIRARKASQDAVRESESRFRAIFESAAVGMVRVALDGKIADCNAAFSTMLGVEREDVIGQSIFAHMHADEVEGARQLFKNLSVDVTAGHQVERRYVSRDGSIVWTKQTISFVRGPEGSPVFAIGVVENVTAQKNLEISLRQAQKLESVGQLASGIAHEINTPVQFVSDSVHFVREAVADLFSVVRSYRALRDVVAESQPTAVAEAIAAEASADLEYLEEQLPKALDRALDGLQRVATIVRGMRAFAHPDQKEKAPSDLNDALETTITIARNEYKYVAEVETDFGDLPPVVCHVGELNQVFLNIIVNAAHAIGDVVGGTERKGCIRIRTWREDDFALIAITDTGSGIPEAVRHRIFDPFFTTKEVGRGTGQGLAIARSVVVEKHQGALTFETELGRGTTFTIRLPIGPPKEGSKAA